MSESSSSQVARNFRLNVAEGVTFFAGCAFFSQQAILPLFVSHYTSAPWALGLLAAITTLGMTLPQVLGAALAARCRAFWPGVWQLTLMPRVALAIVCLTPFLPGSWALLGFFLAYAVYCVAIGVNSPIWYAFVGHVIAPERRGRFFGLRSTLGGVASLGAVGVASWLLGHLPHPWNFGACFILAAVLLFSGLGLMLQTRHDWASVDAAHASHPPFLATAKALVREPGRFRRYVLCRMILSGWTMGMAFYVVYAVERFHLSAATGSLLAIAFVFLPQLAGVLLGQIADVRGNKWVQVPVSLLAAAAHGVMLVAPSLPIYAACLFLIGCGTVVFTITDGKWLLELGAGRAATGSGLLSLALAPTSALLPLLAGWAASGFGMGVVFVATALAWGVGGLALALFVPERRGTGAPVVERAA